MISLRVPDPPETGGEVRTSEASAEGTSLHMSAEEREAQVVLAVNLAEPASRARARRMVEALRRGGASITRSKVLDRQILALAQADSGSSRVSADLQRLATKARELDRSITPRRRGFLGRLLPAADKGPNRMRATLDELELLVASLSESAEVLRQNNVALDGYEADINAESAQVAADIERADAFWAALSAAIAQAREQGASPDVVRFAMAEVLSPLEMRREHLQGLLAVNQQAALSLSILRDTNSALISHVRQVTLATRHSLAIANTLGRFSDGQTARVPADASDAPSNLATLQESLDRLLLTLERHDAWREEVAGLTETAITELRELSEQVFEGGDAGVSS